MRILKAVILVGIITALCVYSGLFHPGLTLDECLADPDAHNGAVIYSPNEATVGEIFEGGFTLRWDGREIPVHGSNPRLKTGVYSQVKAVFHARGYLDAIEIRVGSYRRLKIAVSVIAVFIVAFLLKKSFRWDRRENAFVEKQS